MQTIQAAVWAVLGALCVLSIAWGATRQRGSRPPLPFFAVQAAFALVCGAMAAQSASVAALPLRMPGYVDGLLKPLAPDSPQPAALTPDALEKFIDARGRVQGVVHHVHTTVLPSSRTLFVEVTFANSDVLLLSVAYRDSRPEWMPVSFGPYEFFIESSMFLPYHPSPRNMIAELPTTERTA